MSCIFAMFKKLASSTTRVADKQNVNLKAMLFLACLSAVAPGWAEETYSEKWICSTNNPAKQDIKLYVHSNGKEGVYQSHVFRHKTEYYRKAGKQYWEFEMKISIFPKKTMIYVLDESHRGYFESSPGKKSNCQLIKDGQTPTSPTTSPSI